jgi:pimeloyl-ACP methyl ester carboxylesterase
MGAGFATFMTTLVLLPGMDGSGLLFANFVAALAANTQVVSYPPDQPLDYSGLEKLIEAALPTEPFILLGESFSGPLAISLASRSLPGLRGVVLVCTFAKSPGPPMKPFIRKLFSRLPIGWTPVFIASRLLMGRFDSPSLRMQLDAATCDVSGPVWRTRMDAILGLDVTAALSKLTLPILYLRATEDRVVPKAAFDAIAAANRAVKLVEIEGPHALLQTKPHESAIAIRTFANDIGASI